MKQEFRNSPISSDKSIACFETVQQRACNFQVTPTLPAPNKKNILSFKPVTPASCIIYLYKCIGKYTTTQNKTSYNLNQVLNFFTYLVRIIICASFTLPSICWALSSTKRILRTTVPTFALNVAPFTSRVLTNTTLSSKCITVPKQSTYFTTPHGFLSSTGFYSITKN